MLAKGSICAGQARTQILYGGGGGMIYFLLAKADDFHIPFSVDENQCLFIFYIKNFVKKKV